MNVAFFTDTFIPKLDGIVTSILNTSGELIRQGHRVKIFAPQIRLNQKQLIKEYNPQLEVTLIPGIPALFYPDYRITVPVFPWIAKRLKEFKADIIHFHTPFTMGFESILASFLLKIPLVSTFHTYFTEPEYLKIVKLDWIPGLTRFGWAFSNFYHDRSLVTVSPSRWTAEELQRKGLKCPVRIISNGVPLKKPRILSDNEKMEIRNRLGLREKTIIYVGRISEEKGLDVLLKAGKIILDKYNNTSLMVVGYGPALDKLKRMTSEMEIADRVIFTGKVPYKNLIEDGYYEISRCFATASTSENQPMTIIEACMFGLPLVGVNAKGVPEMVQGNGFIGEPGNHEEMAGYLEKIINDDNLYQKMRKKSLELGASYDISRTTGKMLELYNELLNGKKENK